MSDDLFESSPDPELRLVAPIVVVQPRGPYDPASFIAGARMENWRCRLDTRPVMHVNYEPPELVPQLELLAMEYRYSFHVEPYDDEWSLVEMRRGDYPKEVDE